MNLPQLAFFAVVYIVAAVSAADAYTSNVYISLLLLHL